MTNQYPRDWNNIARQIKERANWTCEHCGATFDTRGKAHTRRNRNGKPSILTVHHLDGNPTNCDYTNLIAVCQACHLHIQTTYRPGADLPWNPPPVWITRRAIPFNRIQLPLWSDQ